MSCRNLQQNTIEEILEVGPDFLTTKKPTVVVNNERNSSVMLGIFNISTNDSIFSPISNNCAHFLPGSDE